MNGRQTASKSLDPRPQSMTVPIATMIGVDYLILLPVFIVCSRLLYINIDIQSFRSRRPVITVYILCITFLLFAFVEPYRLIENEIRIFNSFIPLWISSSVEYSLTLALLLCYCQRCYLIDFDFNFNEAILSKEWKQFTSRHQSQLAWYTHKRNTFGNRTFTLTIVLFPIWLTLCTLFTAVHYHYTVTTPQYYIIVLALFVVQQMFILKLILRMPGLDVFRIRDEYMYSLTLGFLFCVILSCLLLFYDEIIAHILYHSSVMIGSVAFVAVSIVYPYRVHYSITQDLIRDKKPKKLSPVQSVSVQMYRLKSSPHLSPAMSPKSITEMIDSHRAHSPMSFDKSYSFGNRDRDHTRVALEDLLKSFVGIESFLRHLVKELSAENLFFLSDIVQYKHAFVSEGICDEIQGWDMRLPLDDIPQSNILTECANVGQRSALICDRYIRADSEREINISYQTRKNIVSAFDELDVITKPEPLTYHTRFDIAADEIRKLLADSFRRFCLTPEYKAFCRGYNAPVKRLHRKWSKSVKSFRESSRDQSLSGLSHSPRFDSLKRLQSLTKSGGGNHFRNKLSDINENGHAILPPIALSNQGSTKQNGKLELPTNNDTHTLRIAKFSAVDSHCNVEKSYTSSQSHSTEAQKRSANIIHNSVIIQKHTETLRVKAALNDYPSQSGSSTEERHTNNMSANMNGILSVLQPAVTPPPPQWDVDKSEHGIGIGSGNEAQTEDSKSCQSQFSTAM